MTWWHSDVRILGINKHGLELVYPGVSQGEHTNTLIHCPLMAPYGITKCGQHLLSDVLLPNNTKPVFAI